MRNQTEVAAPDESLFMDEDIYGRHYYRDNFEKIADQHFPECPTAIAANHKRISTLCMCAQLEAAEKAARAEADECLRCHNLPEACKCGRKAQFC